METWEQELHALVDDFLRRSGMAPSSFGAAAVGDRGLVGRLRGGKAVTVPTADRIRRYIAEHPLPPAASPPTDSPAEGAGGAEGADTAGHGQPGRPATGQGGELAGQPPRELEQGVG